MTLSLWNFSLRFYDDPEVQTACLAVQDAHGGDVNVLLCLLWRAQRGEALDAGQVAALDGATAPWREAAVRPLRILRRRLKTDPLLADRDAQAGFRNQIKKLELGAEKLQQQALEAASGTATGTTPRDQAARGNLDAYAATLTAPLPVPLREALIARMNTIAG